MSEAAKPANVPQMAAAAAAGAMKTAGRSGRSTELPEHLKAYKGVWVFIEHDRGQVHSVSWELMGEARKLADKLGVEVSGVLLGGPADKLEDYAREAYTYGADHCYIMRDPVLQGYRNEPYTKGLTDLVNKHQPEIMLLGATTMGRDLAGSVATTLGTGLTADCTELNIDGRALAATRPTFGGSLLCTIMTLAYRPQMATMRPRTAPMPRRDDGRSGDIITMDLGMVETDIVTKLLAFIPDANRNTVNLAYADIIVTAGQGPEERRQLQAGVGSGPRAGGRGGRHPCRHPGRLAGCRAPGGPDRQDGAAQALHRRRCVGRHPAPRGAWRPRT